VGIYDFIERIQEWVIKKLGEFFCSSSVDKQSCLWYWYQIAPIAVPALSFLFILLCLILIAYILEDHIDKKMWWRSC
jgi:hypothetical protein